MWEKHLYSEGSKRQLVLKSDEMVQNLDNELDLIFEMRQVPISWCLTFQKSKQCVAL